MDQSLTGFYRVGQKLSDVIPVLRITPRATEPSTVSVFLSSVKCGRICRAQTCAHSGIEPSTLAKGFQRMGQTFEKNSNFWPFLAFTSPISQRPLKIEAYKQRMKLFDPFCRNTEICPPWKSCLECEWRVCVSFTDALVYLFTYLLTYLPKGT